ncbi:MAG TPA: hypothetical protein V6D00_06085 [Pantanalinema sp.]
MNRFALKAVAVALTVSTFPAALASAAFAAPTPTQLVRQVLDSQGSVSYTGKRVQLLTRQTLALKASMRVFYQDDKNYRVTVQEPSTLTGVNLWMKDNRANVFFPAENLLFRNDNPTGSNEAASTIFGQLTANPALLQRNYSLRILSDAEEPNSIVAMTPCYVLEAEPIRGYVTPGHRFWISRDTNQVLKEERTWGKGLSPYFSSYFEDFVPSPRVDTEVGLPSSKLNTVQLQRDQKNSFVQYRSVEEAEKAIGEKVALPTYMPAGFQLHSLQFASFFGTRITLLHYTDGLNWMFVSYRPKPNMFLTVMAGAMALGLVDKMSSLSYQAPYNYFGTEQGGQLLYAYGDLYPDDLQRTVNSVTFASAAK